MNKSAAPAVTAGELTLAGGAVLMISLSVLWGANWPAMKAAVAEIPILTFRVICLYGGGLGMYLLARLGGLSFRIPRNELLPLLVDLLQHHGLACLFPGLKY
jgi:drug/metabolite transporter (DMT)-like permease